MILVLRPANERRRYKVTPSLIGWAQTCKYPQEMPSSCVFHVSGPLNTQPYILYDWFGGCATHDIFLNCPNAICLPPDIVHVLHLDQSSNTRNCHSISMGGRSERKFVAWSLWWLGPGDDMWRHVDGLMQERRNSIANALELRLSCTNPSMFIWVQIMACGLTASSYFFNQSWLIVN